MTKLLSSLIYRVWLIVATLIVLIAILISIGRTLIPYANNYKHHLESNIAEMLGQEVSIGEITAEWKSLGPSITLEKVEIKNIISVDSVSTDIKTIPSIFYGTLITENLTIKGIELFIEQQDDGALNIAGQEQNTTTDSQPFDYALLQDWLQSQNEITITEASINVSLRNQDSYPINISEMTFRRGKNMYQLQGFTQFPGDNRIDFVLEADGLLTNPATKGLLFIDTHELDLSEIPLSAFWQEAKILAGSVKLNAWIDWANLRFNKAIATLDINDYQMTLQDAPQGVLNQLSTQLLWQQFDDGWQLQTNGAEVRSNNRDWPSPFIQIRMRQGRDFLQQYYLRSSRLDIGIWADLLLAKDDLDPELRQRLLVMDPQGFLNAVQIDAVVSPSRLVDLNMSARFSELNFKRYQNTPGIQNMAGQIQLLDDSGSLYLDSRYATYHDPNLFRWELPIDYINANIGWTLSDDFITLNIHHFTTDIHQAILRTDGQIRIPRKDKPLHMDLYAELTDGDMTKTSRFLPYGIMNDNLVEYLDSSVISGQLEDVKVLLRGRGDQFPYTNNEGVFAIHGKVKNSEYRFQENWPTLTGMDADLWFIGNGMEINVNAARSVNHTIRNADVIIEDFSQKPVNLLIKTNSQGDLADANDYIINSPLNEVLTPVTDALEMKGPFQLSLDMQIPLSQDDERINGEIRIDDASVTVKQINLLADHVSGSVQIDNGYVSSRDLTAHVLGGTSRINLKQSTSTEEIATELNLSGEILLDSVYETFGALIPTGLSGKTDYQGLISIPSADALVDVTINTRTVGMVSEIPHPLSKTEDIGLPLKLNFKQLPENRSRLALDWLDKFSLLTAFENDQMTSGVIALGTNEVLLPERPGMAITGTADTVDLVSWLDYLSDLEASSNTTETTTYDDYYLDNLSIKQLNYFFLDFENTKVSGDLGRETLQFILDGDDINGTVTVPLPIGERAIDISLDKLQIDDQFADVTENPSEVDKIADAEPLPAINLNCKQCFYTNFDIGETTVNLSPLANGNKVSIKVETDNILSMDVNASWYLEDDAVFTELEGKAKTRDLGRLLNILHQDAGIRDTPMELDGQIRWLGDPSMFNTETLSGTVTAKGGKGSQKQLSDRKARIFSLFSLGSIARKLTLDFSDLFEDGFFYSAIGGTLAFDQGIMTTDDVSINGTSANVQVRGEIDFTQNKIEQCILVTPDLGSSLPVLAGWAIEPVTGFFVFLMSKIFQPAIDVVSSIRYQVEGSFDEPTVTEIGKSRARATISEDLENPSITVEQNEKPFSCDEEFK